jgi:chromosome partitioning protein
LDGTRRGWREKIPGDAQRVIVDTAAGTRADDVEELLDFVDAIVVPVLPSPFDLEASLPFLAELAELKAVKRGKVPVGIVANRLRPWTHATQQALAEMKQFPFPVIAELRDTQGYVMATGLGKSLFDYHSENVRHHQDDWKPLLRWLKKLE